MTFVSYSQNAEDVLLWRALGHVANGFYIDVGANDPVEHSVTKAFYERGWRGISIEPLPAFHHEFELQRPRDINLAIAAGATDGELTLYDVPDVRGWASPDQAVAEMHRADGHSIAELTVPVRTLASVCAEHVQGEIHFLKIDVEGFEGAVLEGMDFARWRPWVLVIEATLPGSRETNHASWEHVFDDYISHHLDKAWDQVKSLDTRLNDLDAAASDAARQAEARLVEIDTALRAAHATSAHEAARAERAETQRVRLEEEKQHADEQIVQLREQLAHLHETARQMGDWARGLDERLKATMASTSWRVTRPLRQLGSVMHALRRPHLMRKLVNRITANERIRRAIIPVLRRHPALGERVSASIATIKLDPPQQAPAGIEVPEELKGLPLSARAVLADLQRARGNQQADS